LRENRNEVSKEVHEGVQTDGDPPSAGRPERGGSGSRAFSGVGQKRAEESRVAELERRVGRQALEIDVLRRALHVVRKNSVRASLQ